MVEMAASDVPRSWRSLLYVGALCGGSNVYRCEWLPRWLRCLSAIYQVIILITYIIVISVAPAVYHSSPSLSKAFEMDDIFSIYLIPILSNIVILRQTFQSSGVFALCQRWRSLQIGNSYAVNNKIRHGAVIIIVGLITISLGFIFISISTFRMVEPSPALDGHNTQDVILWVHVIIRIFAWAFCYSYLLLCFVVVIDIIFIVRILRERLEDVFLGLIVDAVALKSCVNRLNGIWTLVGAANNAFGVLLGMYLVWIVPNIVNLGFQVLEGKEILYLPPLASGVGILILILVPSAILAAQVIHLFLPATSRDNTVMGMSLWL